MTIIIFYTKRDALVKNTFNIKKLLFFFGLAGCFLGFGQTTYNVTFQVDMNNYNGAFTTPEMNGDFKGWCGIRAAITDLNNDGIWEVAVMGLSYSIEFKFSNDE